MAFVLKAALFSFVPGLVIVFASFVTSLFYAGDAVIFGEGLLNQIMLETSAWVLANALLVVFGGAVVVFVFLLVEQRRHPNRKW